MRFLHFGTWIPKVRRAAHSVRAGSTASVHRRVPSAQVKWVSIIQMGVCNVFVIVSL